MQAATQDLWRTAFIESGRPTLGNLMGLCEENYRALMRLIPDLRKVRGEERAQVDQDRDLFGVSLFLQAGEHASCLGGRDIGSGCRPVARRSYECPQRDNLIRVNQPQEENRKDDCGPSRLSVR